MRKTNDCGILFGFDTMRSLQSIKKSPSSWILWITATHVLTGLIFCALWLITQKETWIRYFFDYQSALFFSLFGGLALGLGIIVWSQFSEQEPLRSAWLLILLSAAFRFFGFVLAHILGIRSYLNPCYFLNASVTASQTEALRNLGLAVSGPVQMGALACGLFLVLRLYKRLIRVRLTLIDYLLLLTASVYVLRQLYEFFLWLGQGEAHFTVYKLLSWITDPLLGALLFEAIVIRRCVAEMGGRYIAKCWGAFTIAIFLTSLGDIGIWAVNYGYIPYPFTSITWFIWFFPSAAYVLAPAYLIEGTYRVNTQVAGEKPTYFIAC